MLEGIPLSLGDMSLGGLLIVQTSFIILALVKGWIVVKIHYDAAVKAAENYRTVSEKKTETIHLQAQTIHEHQVVGETVVRVMNTLQEASKEGSP